MRQEQLPAEEICVLARRPLQAQAGTAKAESVRKYQHLDWWRVDLSKQPANLPTSTFKSTGFHRRSSRLTYGHQTKPPSQKYGMNKPR